MIAEAAGTPVGGYGTYLLQTTLLLLALAAIALLALRLLRRRSSPARGLRLVGELALDARRAVYVVEAGGRCFLIGASEGAMTLVAELDAAKVAEAMTAGDAPSGTGGWLARLLGGGRR